MRMLITKIKNSGKIVPFLTGQAISLFGSSLVQFAINWYVALKTNSGASVAIATICGFMPQIAISLLAGVWADRYNRKMLIILSDSFIACSTLLLAIIMILGYESLGLIFFISAIRSVGSGIQTPAVNAVIPQLVGEEKLLKVNGINGTIQSLVNLAAPAVAGAVLGFGIQYVLLIDVITAIIGVSLLLRIKIPLHEKAAKKKKTSGFSDLVSGLKYTWTHPFINNLLVFYILFTIGIVPGVYLNVLMVTRVFGENNLYLTLNEMAFFVGSLLGGFIISVWGGFKNRLMTLAAGCFIYASCIISIGIVRLFPLYLIIMIITGFTTPAFNASPITLLQEKVEPDMQGRVFSFVQMIFSAVMPAAILGFGPLADRIKLEWIMIGSGIYIITLTSIMLSRKSLMKEGLSRK